MTRLRTMVTVDVTAPAASGTAHRSYRIVEREEGENLDKFIVRIDDAIESAENDVHESIRDLSPWQTATVRTARSPEVHVMPNDGCHDERRVCPCGPREIEPGLWLHTRTVTA